MNPATGNIFDEKLESNRDFSPREFLAKFVRYLPWLFVSVIICLGIAFTKLRYSPNVYVVEGKLSIKKQQPTMRTDKFESLLLSEGVDNLTDEIEQIRSLTIAKRVITENDLQKSYYNKGKIRSTLVYRKKNPFILEVVSLLDTTSTHEFLINLINDNKFTVGDDTRQYNFNQIFEKDGSRFRLIGQPPSDQIFGTNQFEVFLKPLRQAAKDLIFNLNVSVVTEYSNLISIKYETENTVIGEEIVNGIMSAYQDMNLEDKRQISVNALMFINEQLDTLRIELGSVEKYLQQFREKNNIIDVEKQSSLYFENMSEVQVQLTDLEIKKRVVESLLRYLSENRNEHKMVPASLGIPEPAMIQLINEYNQAQLRREVLLKSTPSLNPVVKDIEAGIEKLRQDIVQSLENVRESYSVALNNLTEDTNRKGKALTTIPGKQKQLIEITRQQKILEGLYSLLLQKKLETSISSASTIYNSKIIDSADASDLPVKPNRGNYYMIALLIGLMIPIAVVAIKELFNDKVVSRADIEKSTKVPVVGEIGHADLVSTLIMTADNRTYAAEQFRILRTNLQFFTPRDEKPVILVTSSFSGEGKSFVSTNFGAALALSGRKTVIFEFDIRKPKILKGLGLSESRGITNFLIGFDELETLIKPSNVIDNLYVLPCGPIPPNPSELLLDTRIKELFDYAKANFDAIIVDTAPAGMISDAITLGQYVNTSVFIVRHNYTLKKQIRLIEEINVQQKLPRLSIVINDVVASGGYAGGYYGYGYGYGYGYFENGKKIRKKGIFRNFFNS